MDVCNQGYEEEEEGEGEGLRLKDGLDNCFGFHNQFDEIGLHSRTFTMLSN